MLQSQKDWRQQIVDSIGHRVEELSKTVPQELEILLGDGSRIRLGSSGIPLLTNRCHLLMAPIFLAIRWPLFLSRTDDYAFLDNVNSGAFEESNVLE
jgi:hypothetical protein